ncbi:TPA: hypothetical protein JLY04_004483 [Escherichia coli]|uniref:PapB/FocB family fimbrial expression transcriptional regulator n=1 Tax=Escherichia coli TaxID=562 RepID=UPI0008FBCC4B|nr:PapB/FocB family fimbrial expression transcriptional regulator [Escherichia coli]EEV8094880.1 hypothetical protein [Escherichia coli]EEW4266715.1 hypothetical protein [Escherichia coli]EEW4702551.1 hypothetical protein [Escherichia coli]EEX0418638.1 hypothetical protein [Escherichia coli]EEZ4617056.1 hypothetical protein [Escherichia coli]
MRQISVKNIYNPPQRLEPGRVDKEHLTILIDISSIRSAKVILALYEYYSHGEKRKTICEKYGVNPGYLSLKIRELQDLNSCIYNLLPFYIDKIASPFTD